MFLKLTKVDAAKKVLVNMDFVSVIDTNAIGRSVILWHDPDLEGLVVKETPDEILILLERGR